MSDIAKNLLLERTCEKCKSYIIEPDGKEYCFLTTEYLPEDNTCKEWEYDEFWSNPLAKMMREINDGRREQDSTKRLDGSEL